MATEMIQTQRGYTLQSVQATLPRDRHMSCPRPPETQSHVRRRARPPLPPSVTPLTRAGPGEGVFEHPLQVFGTAVHTSFPHTL